MDRKSIYAEIKKYNLEGEIKKRYGKNYTNVSSFSLEQFLSSVLKVSYCSTKASGSLEKLVQLLVKKHILLKSEVAEIFK